MLFNHQHSSCEVVKKMLNSEEKIVVASCAALSIAYGIHVLQKRRRRQRSRNVWVKEWLQKRDEKGAYNNILQELRLNDAENFRRFIRMNTETYQVDLSKPHSRKRN